MAETLSDFANFELGEAFFQIVSKMVIADGIPFTKIGDFEIVSQSWRKLANKDNKTPDEFKQIDEDYKMEIRDLADSCVIYMAAKTNNKSYKFSLDDYKTFLNILNSDKNSIQNDKISLEDFNKKLEVEFKKLANHGEVSGDNLIDNKDKYYER